MGQTQQSRIRKVLSFDLRTHQLLSLNLDEFKENTDPLNLFKIETALQEIWRPSCLPEEKEVLGEAFEPLLESNVYVGYFLAAINLKISQNGSSQLRVGNEGCVFLTTTFNTILTSSLEV